MRRIEVNEETQETTEATEPQEAASTPYACWALRVWRAQEVLLRRGNFADGEICSDGFIFNRELTQADWLMDRTQEPWEKAYARAQAAIEAPIPTGGKKTLVALACKSAAELFLAVALDNGVYTDP